MAEDSSDIATLTYELLRRLQGQFSRLELKFGELKGRVGALGGGMALMRQEMAQQSGLIAGLNAPMDRFDERLARIERRLDLTEV